MSSDDGLDVVGQDIEHRFDLLERLFGVLVGSIA